MEDDTSSIVLLFMVHCAGDILLSALLFGLSFINQGAICFSIALCRLDFKSVKTSFCMALVGNGVVAN